MKMLHLYVYFTHCYVNPVYTAGLCPEENSAEGREATPGVLLAEILAPTLGLQSRLLSTQNNEVVSSHSGHKLMKNNEKCSHV